MYRKQCTREEYYHILTFQMLYWTVSDKNKKVEKPLDMCQKVYLTACSRDGITPRKKVVSRLTQETLSAKDYLLRPEDITALSFALTVTIIIIIIIIIIIMAIIIIMFSYKQCHSYKIVFSLFLPSSGDISELTVPCINAWFWCVVFAN